MYVYVIATDLGICKIGATKADFKQRINSCVDYDCVDTSRSFVIECHDCYMLEKALHNKLCNFRILDIEKYKPYVKGGFTEWFSDDCVLKTFYLVEQAGFKVHSFITT